METISGGPSDETRDFQPNAILQAAKLNKALENWVVTEVPGEDEGEIGDVVFVTGPGDGGSPGGGDLSGYAPLNSPIFTGTPQAPTAANGTNTTQLATTQFVMSNRGALKLLADIRPAPGSTEVPVNNVFTSDYDLYVIDATLIGSVNNTRLRMRMRTDSGNHTSGEYFWCNYGRGYGLSEAITGVGSNVDSSWTVNEQLVNGQARHTTINVVRWWDSGQYSSMTCQGSGHEMAVSGGGYLANSADFQGFTLFPESGSISGFISVYGMVDKFSH